MPSNVAATNCHLPGVVVAGALKLLSAPIHSISLPGVESEVARVLRRNISVHPRPGREQ